MGGTKRLLEGKTPQRVWAVRRKGVQAMLRTEITNQDQNKNRLKER